MFEILLDGANKHLTIKLIIVVDGGGNFLQNEVPTRARYLGRFLREGSQILRMKAK